MHMIKFNRCTFLKFKSSKGFLNYLDVRCVRSDEELVMLRLGPDLGRHGAQLLVLGHLKKHLLGLLNVVLGAANRHLWT